VVGGAAAKDSWAEMEAEGDMRVLEFMDICVFTGFY